MKILKRIFFLFLLFPLFVSCANDGNTRLNLDDNVYWAYPGKKYSLDSVSSLPFYKLPDFKNGNLKRIAKKTTEYLWLKIDFEVPEQLKYHSLGFVIPYLHFSEEVYFNGMYIGGYGKFPPNEYSAQYATHFFTLPADTIDWNHTNSIYIKVFIKGRATISDGIFIDDYNKAKDRAELLDFLQSKIYILFEGFLIFASIFFLVISRGIKEDEKPFRKFAYINLIMLVFMCFFFADEIPWYQGLNISNLILTKIVLCVPLYWMLYNLTSFIAGFLDFKVRKTMSVFGLVSATACSILTLAAPTYEFLMKICPYTLTLALLNVCDSVYFIIKGLVLPEKRQKDIYIISGFAPLVLSIIFDVIYKNILGNTAATYIALYGWVVTVITFLVYTSTKYKKIATQNERLTKFLSDEVEMKTVDLTFANERLERELTTSATDMDMAAIVQQKFYPQKNVALDGWEFSVYFDPMNKISGDLYDYYSDGEKLHGIGLFDVSGHGVAASLVAMLAKSLIFRAFNHSRISGETVSTTLEEINKRVILEKGDVQNYLTGMLLRFAEFNEDDTSLVELSSAGHPYPLMYSAKEDKIITVTHDDLQEQYGAIGIQMTAVSFPNVDLTLGVGDVLVLYTDGLTEAQNEDKEELGKEAIEQILLENHEKTTIEIVQLIKSKVLEFIGDAPRSDDITFIVLKRVSRWTN